MIHLCGPFQIDEGAFELRRDGTRIPVQRRVFDLLVYLVRVAPSVATKDDLLREVWGGARVGESVIARAVRELRRALGDEGERLVETARGRGYRFAGEVVAQATRASPRAPLVGRAEPLARLLGRLEAAIAGTGGVVLVEGEPGIGKTRLSEEFAAVARARGARVLAGRGYDGEGSPPFWPWAPIARELDEPELRLIASGAAREAADPRGASWSAPAEARFRVFEALTRALHAASRAAPLVVALDDLHWADDASLLLLEFLARELRGARVLVIGTCRRTAERSPVLARAIGTIARADADCMIPLEGLDRDAVAAFVRESTGEEPGAATLDDLVERTGGNPLFLTQLARVRFAGALPEGVRQAIQRHLDVLPEDCRRVLVAASVLGRSFGVAQLASMTARPPDALLDVLDAAVATSVVVLERAQPPAYRFAHALVRDAVYGELTPTERGALHAAAGDALRAHHASALDDHLAAIAYHFAKAAGSGRAADAIAFAIRAAEDAARRFAWESAAELYGLALAALDLAPDAPRRLEVLLGAGLALSRAGDADRARAALEEAAALARSLGDAESLGRAAFLAALEPESGHDQAWRPALLSEALQALADRRSATVALCTASLAHALWTTGDVARRMALSERAVRIARQVGDREALGYTLKTRHYHLALDATRVDERLAVAAELMALARATTGPGAREAVALALTTRIQDAAFVGDARELDRAVDELEKLAEELRQPYLRWCSVVYRAMRALARGRLADAERLVEQARSLGERAANDVRMVWGGVQLYMLRRDQGRLAELEPIIRRLCADFPAIGSWPAGLAYLLVERGADDEARALLRRRVGRELRIAGDVNFAITVELFGEVAARLRDTESARTLYEALEPLEGRQILVGPAIALDGCASRTLGMLAAAIGRYGDAEEHFARAVRADEAMGSRPAVAYAQVAWAEALVERDAARDRGRASTLVGAAKRTAQAVGMPRLVARAAALEDVIARGRSRTHAAS
jgi:DNA-binding winged helix-turn-helix (wHTH) protein